MLAFVALLSAQQLTSWLCLLPDCMGLWCFFFLFLFVCFFKLPVEGEGEFGLALFEK